MKNVKSVINLVWPEDRLKDVNARGTNKFLCFKRKLEPALVFIKCSIYKRVSSVIVSDLDDGGTLRGAGPTRGPAGGGAPTDCCAPTCRGI